jgi:AraC family transcriptional activator of pobA
MQSTPLFGLYGESQSQALIDGLHIESIAQRSQLYDWEITPHRHEDFLQILYIDSGSGTALLGLERQEIQSPCIMLVPRLIPHGFRFEKDVHGWVITLHHIQLQQLLTFESNAQENLQSAIQIHLSRKSDDWLRISGIMDQLQDEFTNSKSWRNSMITNHLLSLFIHIFRQLPKNNFEDQKGNRASLHVERFKRSLDQSFREHRPITEYAQELGITHTQLNRVCKDVLGKTALEVIHNRIITEAQRDLTYSNLAIKEIAYTLGFEDEAYFTRFFKRMHQISPSQFRQKAGKSFMKLAQSTNQL